MKKIQPIKLPQTPITDETFVKQGWRKEVDDENPKEEVYQWILSLPKESRDPYCLQLISTANTDRFPGMQKGTYGVQLLDCNGLGSCTTKEEIEILYKTLTKKSIYA